MKQKIFFVILLIPILLISCTTLHAGDIRHEFTLIGTADLQGNLEPSTMKIDLDGDGKKEMHSMGGISRIATLIKKIKAEKQKTVAVVSTGDDLMNRYFHTFNGKAIFPLLSKAGYEIYVFGNHEFDKGPEILANAVKTSDFQYICSDLNIKNTPLEALCMPWLIRDYKGLAVGFFSLMTEDFPFVTSGKDVTLAHNNIETAQKMVLELRKRGAHVIVALTHIGYKNDLIIARKVKGIDIIFGGHSHEYLPNMVREGDTIIVNGGEKGTFLVRIDLTIDSHGEIDFDTVKYQLIAVTSNILADAEIEKILGVFKKNFPEEIILGRTDVEWDMTVETLRRGEAPVADLINDLLYKKFSVDIVLNNAGAFRGRKMYQPGPITDVMLKEIDEFSNYAYILDIQGKYVKEILERSASDYDQGGFLHPSGLRYQIDIKKTPQKIEKNESGDWVITEPGQRVREITILDKDGKWKPMDTEKMYRLLSNSFLVNQQGDGYFWFQSYGENIKNTYSTFYSILTEYVSNEKVVNPAKPDGRIIVKQ